MTPLSRLHKERALKAEGVEVPAYPVPPAAVEGDGVDARREADRVFLQACAAWDEKIDRLYLQLVQRPPQAQPGDEVRAFVDACHAEGLTAALTRLNERVPHRYTALYRLDASVLKNVELIDKAREVRPEFLAAVPLTDSFCQFVLRDGAFLTSDSGEDDRLDGHPYKGVMVAYHGVPVLDGEGELFGSLCHFDVRQQPLSDTEYAHLQGVARALSQVLPRSGAAADTPTSA
ncbi:GAF domain-containing protein [Variovorax sp. J22P168]|uniref:GAF domain-containing protein n=1 Tax=Variovorax jilinensis TaxID=3053513 RepID=UPI0025749A23|nr:GAF domain-containing protein [Variovorax sp. J22P168]MDM0011956.1 GAF domain-containing protein [Variovorax sp. J22P168]